MAKNSHRIDGDVAFIRLRRRDGTELETMVDVGDLERVLAHPYRWCAHWDPDQRSFYCYARKDRLRGPPLRLHRFLMEPVPGGFTPDHRNRDTLDNRRSNLRLADGRAQCLNHGYSIGASGLRGVDTYRGRWRARIRVNGQLRHLGFFATSQEAGDAYTRARAAAGEGRTI